MPGNNDDGFFDGVVRNVTESLEKNVSNGSIFDVRVVRRFLNIKAKNRSMVAFIARALARLEEQGVIEAVGDHTPKKYKRKKQAQKSEA